jgi:endonuclease IV
VDSFYAIIGLKYLRGMHLNDSKTPLGSHKDRHANIGQCVCFVPALFRSR